MFWQLTESRSKYRVLLILFSASVLTAVTSIFHAYVNDHLRTIRTSSKGFLIELLHSSWAVLGPTGGLEGIMSNLEVLSHPLYIPQ